MRKIILGSVSALVLVLSGFGFSGAHADPGDHNQHGLCTAYFNGHKNGHGDTDEDGSRQKPFAGLEAAGTAYDAATGGNDENLPDEQQLSDDVFEYCQQYGIGGNPELNGRWDCSDSEEKGGAPRDSDTDGELECQLQN